MAAVAPKLRVRSKRLATTASGRRVDKRCKPRKTSHWSLEKQLLSRAEALLQSIERGDWKGLRYYVCSLAHVMPTDEAEATRMHEHLIKHESWDGLR